MTPPDVTRASVAEPLHQEPPHTEPPGVGLGEPVVCGLC
jgi:hypothetical protein